MTSKSLSRIATRRGVVTWPALVMVVLVLSELFAILVMQLQRARDAANETDCTNHLKEIGLAVHNFEGVYQGVVPATLADNMPTKGGIKIPDSVTWGALLLPYMEAGSIYGRLTIGATSYAGVNSAAESMPLNEDKASLNSFLCAARRTGIQRPKGWTRESQDNLGGTCSDYASVNCPQGNADGMLVGPEAAACVYVGATTKYPNPLTAYGGTMLGAHRYGTNNGAFRPITTFASITDGLSHTFLIGEKQLSKTDFKDPKFGDGNFYYYDLSAANQINSVRVIQHHSEKPAFFEVNSLSQKGENEMPGKNALYAFGSWHVGYVPFLMADGVVARVSTNVDRKVLYHLACRNDGMGVTVDDAAKKADEPPKKSPEPKKKKKAKTE